MSEHNFDENNLREVMKGGMAGHLDMELVECSEKRFVVEMPITEKNKQPFGLLHGGASVALAESIASMAANCHAAREGKVAVGQEINANHIRSVTDGKVTAVAEPLHIGRTSQVWDVKIHDEKKRLVCVSRCTLAVLEAPRK